MKTIYDRLKPDILASINADVQQYPYTTKALKEKLIEVNTSLKFSDVEANEKKSYFEIIYATIVKIKYERYSRI